MRIGILARPSSWYLHDLVRAAAGAYEIEQYDFGLLSTAIATCEEVSGSIRSDIQVNGKSLLDLDVCLVRTMPPGSLEQVVFRMDLLSTLQRSGVAVINPPRSIEQAVDKYVTTQLLKEAGVTVPPTFVGQDCESAMEAFDALGGDVVIKPIFGSEGRGMARLSDPDLAYRAFRSVERAGEVIYLQQFIEHAGFDIRVLQIGDKVFSVKRYANDWRTNLARGAEAVPHEPSQFERELCRHAAKVLGTPFAGVDLLPARDGTTYVLEVNAVPGWQKMAPVIQVDIGKELLRFCRDYSVAIIDS